MKMKINLKLKERKKSRRGNTMNLNNLKYKRTRV